MKLSDADVTATLGNAVRIIDPLLNALWRTDPIGLKRRTVDFDGGPLDKVADGVTWTLNAVDMPGTPAWDTLDADTRIRWWVRRVGAMNNVLVAFPGLLGVLSRAMPLQDVLGFVNQAIVLCAVARELGVTDPDQQARMLAEVLCDRDLSDPQPTDVQPVEPVSRTPWGIAKALWRLAGLFNAIGDELAKRPHPNKFFDRLARLPWIGAVMSYLGEGQALSGAADEARRWVAANG